MSIIPDEMPRYDQMQEVVELYVQNVKPYTIAKKLGIRKVDVDAHIEEWKKTAVGMKLMEERVEDLLASMDEHYGTLIQKLHEIIDEVDEDQGDPKTRAAFLSQKANAIKSIADLHAKRIDILQKSGLTDIGDDLARMEEEFELVMTILDEELCQSCNDKVFGRIRAYKQGGAVVIVNG